MVDCVAQLVEQYTFNVWVLGSSPSAITNDFQTPQWIWGVFYSRSDPANFFRFNGTSINILTINQVLKTTNGCQEQPDSLQAALNAFK